MIGPYEAIDPDILYAPLSDWLPGPAGMALDVGAGTGRDAAWLAEHGHRVLAVEPVAAFRAAGQARHASAAIDWLDDRLPRLTAVRGRAARFDLILLSGVWQHLRPDERDSALPVLAALTVPEGRVILSLRHGAGAEGRPCHPISTSETIAAAGSAGLRTACRRDVPSVQPANVAAGVRWTWLVLVRR